MEDEHRDLLNAWIESVGRRPEGACGIFFEGEGQSFGPRGRPWDSPDLLIEGRLDGGDLVISADGAHGPIRLRLTGISEVEQGEHAWGSGLYCRGLVDGSVAEVWLV